MRSRSTILGRFRRRSVGLGRVALAWFALAAASAGATPCFAMTASGEAVAHHGASDDAVAPHDHSPHHDHSLSSGHEHAMHGAGHDEPAAPQSPCPHCPPAAMPATDGAPGAHSFCSAGDDVVDGAKPNVLSTFKTHLSLPLLELGAIELEPRPVRDNHRPPELAAASVALNLRH